jgi:hypothetical protein
MERAFLGRSTLYRTILRPIGPRPNADHLPEI